MTELDAWVPLAEVARPHGVKGELRLKLFNTSSDVLLHQDEVLVRLDSGEEHEVSVESARRADGAILMKLYSVDDRNRAEELRGAYICVRRRDFTELEEGEFYAVDIVGAEARLNGERFGEVIEVMTYPTLETLLVRADDGKGDWEIPLNEIYVGKVDVASRLVEVLTLDELERLPPKKKKSKDRRSKPSSVRADASDDDATRDASRDAEGSS